MPSQTRSDRRVGYLPGQHEIENPDAYDKAVQARIKGAASAKRAREWIQADPSRQALIEEITFRAFDRPGSFFTKMFDVIYEWGSLTPGQEAAVRKIFDGDAARKAARKAEAAARDAGSQHVGLVGERREFRLVLERSFMIETRFGQLVINILRDTDGNIVVYKGKELGLELKDLVFVGDITPDEAGHAEPKAYWTRWQPVEKGQTVVLKATIKAHEVREGINQTIVGRPKMVEIVAG
jgi:hypothetical protein